MDDPLQKPEDETQQTPEEERLSTDTAGDVLIDRIRMIGEGIVPESYFEELTKEDMHLWFWEQDISKFTPAMRKLRDFLIDSYEEEWVVLDASDPNKAGPLRPDDHVEWQNTTARVVQVTSTQVEIWIPWEKNDEQRQRWVPIEQVEPTGYYFCDCCGSLNYKGSACESETYGRVCEDCYETEFEE